MWVTGEQLQWKVQSHLVCLQPAVRGINAALSSPTAPHCPLLAGSTHFTQNNKQMWRLSSQAERCGPPSEESPGWAWPYSGCLHVSQGTGTEIWRTGARLFWVSLCSPSLCGAGGVSSEKEVCWSSSCFSCSLASGNKVNRSKCCCNKYYSPDVWQLWYFKELFSVRCLKEKSTLMIFDVKMIHRVIAKKQP